MTKIAVFGFNTTSGNSLILRDVTIEEIKEEIRKKFPKWSEKAVELTANNKNYYKELIPLTAPITKPKRAQRTYFKTPILIGELEVNPLLRLAKSMQAYHKNGYRQWGICVSEIFDDWKITPYYNDFERKFEKIEKEYKKYDIPTLQKEILALADKMQTIRNIIISSGILKHDTDKEYINGTDRRLGLAELMRRVNDVTSTLIENINK